MTIEAGSPASPAARTSSRQGPAGVQLTGRQRGCQQPDEVVAAVQRPPLGVQPGQFQQGAVDQAVQSRLRLLLRGAQHQRRVLGGERLAVPVGPPDACAELAQLADELICPLQPPLFGAVGEWYADFPPY